MESGPTRSSDVSWTAASFAPLRVPADRGGAALQSRATPALLPGKSVSLVKLVALLGLGAAAWSPLVAAIVAR